MYLFFYAWQYIKAQLLQKKKTPKKTVNYILTVISAKVVVNFDLVTGYALERFSFNRPSIAHRRNLYTSYT